MSELHRVVHSSREPSVSMHDLIEEVTRGESRVPSSHSMRSLLIFARAYPARTAFMLACLLLAGAAEGFSVASAVPLIALAADPAAGSAAGTGGALGEYVLAVVRGLGLEPTIGVLLVLLVAGIVLRAVL